MLPRLVSDLHDCQVRSGEWTCDACLAVLASMDSSQARTTSRPVTRAITQASRAMEHIMHEPVDRQILLVRAQRLALETGLDTYSNLDFRTAEGRETAIKLMKADAECKSTVGAEPKNTSTDNDRDAPRNVKALVLCTV